MDIKFISTFIKRWAWLIGIGLILGALAGLIYSSTQTPIYEARTKIMFTQDQSTRSNGSTAIDTKLAYTLTQLLVTQPVLSATSSKLNYHVSSQRVAVEILPNTQIIQVRVKDEDPQRAALIANTLIEVFVQQNEALQASRYAAEEASLQEQISRVQDQINALQGQTSSQTVTSVEEQVKSVNQILADLDAEIRTLREDLVNLQNTGAPAQVWSGGRLIVVTPTPNVEQQVDTAVKTDRLNELQSLRGMYQKVYMDLTFGNKGSGGQSANQLNSALTLYQQIHSDLLNNLENIRLARLQSTANVTQVEAARVPTSTAEPNTIFNMGLFGAIGLALAAIFAFIREFNDDRFYSLEEVSGVLPLPILGTISRMGPDKHPEGEKPYVLEKPRSPITEAFRSLRGNLDFSNNGQPIKALLVSSPSVAEGKTTLAVNLALVYAQAKKRVVLIDADLRRPTIHRVLGLSNHAGLSDLLSGDITLGRALQPSMHERLSVITSGNLPLAPAETLESEQLNKMMVDLRAYADIIIIDGPPALLADAAILAKQVDGVLMVVQLKQTKAEEALLMLEQFKRAGTQVFGIAVNRAPARPGYGSSPEHGPWGSVRDRLSQLFARSPSRAERHDDGRLNGGGQTSEAQTTSSDFVTEFEKNKTEGETLSGRAN